MTCIRCSDVFYLSSLEYSLIFRCPAGGFFMTLFLLPAHRLFSLMSFSLPQLILQFCYFLTKWVFVSRCLNNDLVVFLSDLPFAGAVWALHSCWRRWNRFKRRCGETFNRPPLCRWKLQCLSSSVSPSSIMENCTRQATRQWAGHPTCKEVQISSLVIPDLSHYKTDNAAFATISSVLLISRSRAAAIMPRWVSLTWFLQLGKKGFELQSIRTVTQAVFMFSGTDWTQKHRKQVQCLWLKIIQWTTKHEDTKSYCVQKQDTFKTKHWRYSILYYYSVNSTAICY